VYRLILIVGSLRNLSQHKIALAVACAITLLSVGAQSPALADEVKCGILKNASVSLREAIESALAKYEGFPVKAELKEQDDMYYYEINLVSEGGRSEVFVNPANGLEIGFQQENGVAVRFQRFWESKLGAILAANISLLQAIETAQETHQGFVSEVELKSRREPHIFEILLLDGEVEREVTIDAKKGKIINVEIDD